MATSHILMITIANVLKRSEIIIELKKAIAEYEKNPTKDNQDRLSSAVALYSTKDLIEREGVESIMKKMQNAEASEHLFSMKDKQN